MKLKFLGATHEVTGSCHLLELSGKKILIDCGMQQGPDEYEHQELGVVPSEVEFVLLTHAHIDHSGRLPLLSKYGFQGKIFATPATCELCGIMLRDSAHIQEFEAEWKNRKGLRAGKEPQEPLYTQTDATAAIEALEAVPYGAVREICEGVRVRFTDVGHLLGSASIEVWGTEDGQEVKLAFSGDIGNMNQPLINDPSYLSEADYIVMESTYGTRLHEQKAIDYAERLGELIQQTFDMGGNVVVPSFAVGRTQELLYFLREIKERGLVRGHGEFKVYVDSPLAIEATQIFTRNEAACYDFAAMDLVRRGINPIAFSGLVMSVTSEESKQINFDPAPKVIISASGMCEAGRIKHHLKHNLWRKESTVVFVGYQAGGTLGRALSEGAPQVKIFGESIDVKARIVRLEGISGHADQAGLERWLSCLTHAPRRVFVVHGESQTCDSFAQTVADKFGYPATAPLYEESWDLLSNLQLTPGVRREPRAPAPNTVFARLRAAGQRLTAIIEQNKGAANKDLGRFADQILALCEKWTKTS